MNPTPPSRFRFGLRTLFVLVTVVAVVCVWGVESTRRERAMARRERCQNLMQELSLAILEYEQSHGEFPPAQYRAQNGTVHSWRVLLLPYLERSRSQQFAGAKRVYDQYSFSENWDGPNNKKLLQSAKNFYSCDSRLGRSECNIFAVVDPRTAWARTETARLPDIGRPSETIELLQVYGREIPWTEPRDLSVDEVLALHAERSDFKFHGMYQAVYVDGHTEDLYDYVGAPEELLRRLTIADELPSQALDLLPIEYQLHSRQFVNKFRRTTHDRSAPMPTDPSP